jgi:phosphoadenosine phosphosulfate reductase
MNTIDAAPLGDPDVTARVAEKLAAMETGRFLRFVVEDIFPGRIALVSSFGADSAVLLHMVAEIDKAIPVLFIDTGLLFPETLAYRDILASRFGLTNIITLGPRADRLAEEDPETFLWARDPDRCCHIRKVLPLAEGLEGFDAWITGRKRFQAGTRANLPLFESDGDRIKVNPLANWSSQDVDGYLETHAIPRHPLVASNYLSIGCIPCTTPVKPGEDSRSGRWRDKGKVECGLHTQALDHVPLDAS